MSLVVLVQYIFMNKQKLFHDKMKSWAFGKFAKNYLKNLIKGRWYSITKYHNKLFYLFFKFLTIIDLKNSHSFIFAVILILDLNITIFEFFST